jgi:hypothetical protein
MDRDTWKIRALQAMTHACQRRAADPRAVHISAIRNGRSYPLGGYDRAANIDE